MTIRNITGDCRTTLPTLPESSVHCVVTSPPYFGLRDYGVAGQIGLEPTPEDFVAEMVAVFREIRRVLRPDGTLWLNLGDSYATSPPGNKPNTTALSSGLPNSIANQEMRRAAQSQLNKTKIGMKPKDLIGIPWRVAFALQADGWYLRQDIIWSKPNPMPESVRDRCTKAHEYLFLLSKSERYYYDADAIKEDAVYSGLANQDESGFKDPRSFNGKHKEGYNSSGQIGRARGRPNGAPTFEKFGHNTSCGTPQDGLRNKRSVWEIPTSPYSEAHFATFPPALIEPCILAGCPKECCAKCGAPWVRQVERTPMVIDRSERTHDKGQTRSSGTMLEPPKSVTLGWSPSCSCNAGVVGGSVLDPLGGAGTTGLVADRLGRNAILIELNPEYAAMAERRIRGDAGMFAEVQS